MGRNLTMMSEEEYIPDDYYCGYDELLEVMIIRTHPEIFYASISDYVATLDASWASKDANCALGYVFAQSSLSAVRTNLFCSCF